MKIFVTQDHITRGKAKSSMSCPIALALQSAGLTEVFVGPLAVEFTNVHGSPCFAFLEPSAREFISNFDNNKPVQPIEFELEEI